MTDKLHVVCSACEKVIPPNTPLLRVDACKSDFVDSVGTDVAYICADCYLNVGKLMVVLKRVEEGTPWTFESTRPVEMLHAPAPANAH